MRGHHATPYSIASQGRTGIAESPMGPSRIALGCLLCAGVAVCPYRHGSATHPLEGSCQEAIRLPSTTFFRCVPPGILYPQLVSADASLFSLPRCRPRCAAPYTHQDQGLGRLAVQPDVRPWHGLCPRKPSVPSRVHACDRHRSFGSLAGPVSAWLTVEASHYSTNSW
jgi:hypothetical protein